MTKPSFNQIILIAIVFVSVALIVIDVGPLFNLQRIYADDGAAKDVSVVGFGNNALAAIEQAAQAMAAEPTPGMSAEQAIAALRRHASGEQPEIVGVYDNVQRAVVVEYPIVVGQQPGIASAPQAAAQPAATVDPVASIAHAVYVRMIDGLWQVSINDESYIPCEVFTSATQWSAVAPWIENNPEWGAAMRFQCERVGAI